MFVADVTFPWLAERNVKGIELDEWTEVWQVSFTATPTRHYM